MRGVEVMGDVNGSWERGLLGMGLGDVLLGGVFLFGRWRGWGRVKVRGGKEGREGGEGRRGGWRAKTD